MLKTAWVYCAVGFALLALSTSAANKETQNIAKRSASSRDSAAGFTFPRHVGNFVRRGSIILDEGGNPIATYWAGALVLVDVYYYLTYGHSLDREYADCRDYVKIYTRDARLISDGEVTISPAGRRHRGHRAVFRFRPDPRADFKGAMKSQLLIFQLRDRFVKFRITYSFEHADRVEEELQDFLNELAWPER